MSTTQISQTFAPWLTQTITLYDGQPYAEFGFVVGSIPIDDDLVSTTVAGSCCSFLLVPTVFGAHRGGVAQGKEVFSRFTSNISSNGAVAMDSNGREMQQHMVP